MQFICGGTKDLWVVLKEFGLSVMINNRGRTQTHDSTQVIQFKVRFIVTRWKYHGARWNSGMLGGSRAPVRSAGGDGWRHGNIPGNVTSSGRRRQTGVVASRQTNWQTGRQAGRQAGRINWDRGINKLVMLHKRNTQEITRGRCQTRYRSGWEYDLATSGWESGGYMKRLISEMRRTWLYLLEREDHAHAQHWLGRGRKEDQTTNRRRGAAMI